jgi:superoxide dismutase, Fe-Mn family
MNNNTATVQRDYKAQDYSHLVGMNGFSEKMLTNHFKLYEAYVKNTNTLLSEMKEASKDNPGASFFEMKRRFGWEFDGMRMHELYFGNLGGKEPADSAPHLKNEIAAAFGTFEAWKNEFITMGAMRGIGWVMLVKDEATGKLMNLWIDEHHVGHCQGTTPLLVMDVFEHAFMTDYGVDKAKYVQAFYTNINWDAVAKRHSKET